MKIEVLFPEYCNLFGDLANMDYLRKCLPEAEFVETPITAKPEFLSGGVDLVYMGPMTERTQERVIKKLMPFRDAINRQIESGKVFLFTGNAVEVLMEYIVDEKLGKIRGLGIFSYYAKRDMMHRHNSNFRGSFEDTEIMGFKTQFTMSYPLTEETDPFIKVEKGVGMNKKAKFEGLKRKNFYATYLTGPILIMNPAFTKKILRTLGVKDALAFEYEVIAAYDIRLRDFKNSNN